MPGKPEPKTTTLVTAAQLESLAADLLDFAAKLQLASKVAKTQEDESLAIYNWASAHNGIKALRGFVARADESRSAAELGRPLVAGQLKPRSTAKQKAKADVAKEEAKVMAEKKTRSKKNGK